MKRILAGCLVVVGFASLGIFATQELLSKIISKPRLIALVKARTGDTLSFDQMRVSTFPHVGLTLTNATLTARMSDDEAVPLLRAKTVDVSVSIMPLLRRRIQLRRVALQDGRIDLSRDKSGAANWIEKRQSPQQGRTTRSVEVSKAAPRDHVHISGVSLRRMSVTLNDAMKKRTGHLFIQDATMDGLTSSSPHIEAYLRHEKTDFSISGHVGPLADLKIPSRPWHIGLGLILGAGEHKDGWISFSGSLRDLAHLQGWSGEIKAKLRRTTLLQALLPHVHLPAIEGLSGRIVFKDNFGKDGPDMAQHASWYQFLRFEMIDVDLGQVNDLTNFSVKDMSLSARNAQDAVKFAAFLPAKNRNWSVQATIPTLDDLNNALRSGFDQSIPFTARLAPSSQRLAFFDRDGVIHINGQFAREKTQIDADGRVHHLPVGPLILEDAVFDAKVTANNMKSLVVHSLKLRSRTLSFEGHGALTRPSHEQERGDITADVSITDADLMGLKQEGQKSSRSSSKKVAIPFPPARERNGQVEAKQDSEAIPGSEREKNAFVVALLKKLPLEGARHYNWTINLRGDGLKFDDRTCKGWRVNAHYTGGLLNAELSKDDAPDSRLKGSVTYDERGSVPLLSLHAAPMVIPATLLARYLQVEPLLDGPVEIVGDLQGPAQTRAQFLQKMRGHVGISMTKGALRTSALRPYLKGGVAGFLDTRTLPLRCLGVHAQITPDVVDVDTLGIEADPVSVSGSGRLDRVSNDLAFSLDPTVSVAGTGALTPLLVRGTLQKPQVFQRRESDGRTGLKIEQIRGDACPALLERVREGLAGFSASAPKKNGGVSRLLKSLGLFR